MVLLTVELQRRARRIDRGPPLSPEQDAFASLGDLSSDILVAAAGSGKTTCLLARLGACLRESAVGSRIEIISFSNSAAETLQTRFAKTWGEAAPRVARTLHSWAKSEVLRAHGVSEERVSWILHSCLRWMEAASADTLNALAHALVLLVDEAQDCCKRQLTVLRILQQHGARVVLVGDPRQSIYGFTGAAPQEMLMLPWERRRLAVLANAPSHLPASIRVRPLRRGEQVLMIHGNCQSRIAVVLRTLSR